MIDVPPSLDKEIIERSFIASNGEVGILLADAPKLLEACVNDGIGLVGYDMWIIDHALTAEGEIKPFPGRWCGAIPTNRSSEHAVMGGAVDPRGPSESWMCYVTRGSEEARLQIARIDLVSELDSAYRSLVRLKFFLDYPPA